MSSDQLVETELRAVDVPVPNPVPVERDGGHQHFDPVLRVDVPVPNPVPVEREV